MSHGQEISRAVLQLRMSSPFFAALLLFALLEPRPGLGTAVTDGQAIYYDPAFFASLDSDGIAAVLLHEVLHCALRHPSRCGRRNPKLWNFAADIVVNGVIAEHGRFKLPNRLPSTPSTPEWRRECKSLGSPDDQRVVLL